LIAVPEIQADGQRSESLHDLFFIDLQIPPAFSRFRLAQTAQRTTAAWDVRCECRTLVDVHEHRDACPLDRSARPLPLGCGVGHGNSFSIDADPMPALRAGTQNAALGIANAEDPF
jgi:hypothetical protein